MIDTRLDFARRLRLLVRVALPCLSMFAVPAFAQHEHAGHQDPTGAASMGHDMGDMPQMQGMLGLYPAQREASGTSWVPDSSPMPGVHFDAGGWDFMAHGSATLTYDDQGGKRGDEDVFSTNMFMIMGSRKFGENTLGVRGMFSLEPATVDEDGYPLLFQTGETGDGTTPLVDRQHPHDLFMELAVTGSMPIGEKRSLFAYVGLPGEPALGPPTFMHRFSGMENPEAPLSHHWLDSTHISYGVATVGTTWGPWKLDASVFNGHEPDEHRWNIESPELNSEAVRLSFNPNSEWALQASFGDLDSPEQLEPDVDIQRTTVSAIYGHAWEENNWQTTLAFGRNDPSTGDSTNAMLLETAITLDRQNIWLARLERVEKDELFGAGDPLAGRQFAIVKLSVGYLHELASIENISIAIGGLGSVYHFDDALDDAYGDQPVSFMVFLRARL